MTVDTYVDEKFWKWQFCGYCGLGTLVEAGFHLRQGLGNAH